ncbi:hypothetical protein EJ04DRAFT_559096 [Polyplosphaeria fusca]|uniref:Luciferase domain-containing protein n=1 Tax=Polyplosphaeria fusca TaxID=682080 RepID=A0A9P4RA40_9PLEO|nr:hypothetical protein EJ04DRAFT_559096 [Polyplosphaeria fusca]
MAAIGIALAAPFAIQDYRTFLSYGPGGLPYNVVGWLVTNAMRLISREALSTRVYDDPGLPFADEPGFLPDSFPPPRSSPRPRLGPHPVPQRQLEQIPNKAAVEALLDRFMQLYDRLSTQGLVQLRQSLLERRHSAMFVSAELDWHRVAQQMRGEITHIHAGLDHSIHVTLHPKDARAVIASGWGQRHGLDGVQALRRLAGFSLPVNYVLLYAPRDNAELDVVMTIVKASIAFMTSTRDALD